MKGPLGMLRLYTVSEKTSVCLIRKQEMYS